MISHGSNAPQLPESNDSENGSPGGWDSREGRKRGRELKGKDGIDREAGRVVSHGCNTPQKATRAKTGALADGIAEGGGNAGVPKGRGGIDPPEGQFPRLQRSTEGGGAVHNHRLASAIKAQNSGTGAGWVEG